MGDLIKTVLRPILAAVMAVWVANCNQACVPPGGDELEAIYRAELTRCVEEARSKKESCYCRKAVDEKWGLCDHPEWPRFGRCDFRCDGL